MKFIHFLCTLDTLDTMPLGPLLMLQDLNCKSNHFESYNQLTIIFYSISIKYLFAKLLFDNIKVFIQ